MRWGREGDWTEVHLRIWGQFIPRRRRGAGSGRSKSSFVSIDHWEQEGQLIIYEEKTGNLKGLRLALEWRSKQASVSHIEGVWRRVVLCGQLLPGIRKEEEGFNHGWFVCFFSPRIISHRPRWRSVWSESRLWVWKLHRKMRSRWRTVAKLAAKILKPSLGFFPVPRSPHHSSNAQRGKSNDSPFLQIRSPYETFPMPTTAAGTTRTKTTTPFLIFHINWQKLSLLEKWNFPVFTFLQHMTGHFCCLRSYVHTSLHTHFKPHSLKQLITRWTKIKDILQGDNHRIYFLYHRKVLSKRVIL